MPGKAGFQNAYCNHEIESKESQIGEVVLCQRRVVQMSMKAANSPETEPAGAEPGKIRDHNLAVVSDDDGLDLSPPGDHQAHLPSDFQR